MSRTQGPSWPPNGVGGEAVHDWCVEAEIILSYLHEIGKPPVAPDDTPTRLPLLDAKYLNPVCAENGCQWLNAEARHDDLGRWLDEAEAEVSRLREELEEAEAVLYATVEGSGQWRDRAHAAESRLEKTWAEHARLEASMLGILHPALDYPDDQTIENLARTLVADVSRLQQENALLRRSLGVMARDIEDAEQRGRDGLNALLENEERDPR
jgi:hypothetical protein